MIIIAERIKVEKVLIVATRCMWVLTAILGSVFAISVAISCHKMNFAESFLKKDFFTVTRPFTLPLEKIGQGPLSLYSMKRKAVIPDVSQELILLSKNVRPDRAVEEVSFMFLLKSSRLERRVKSGQLIFLSCDSSSGGALPVYRFSEKKTPLWIRPTLLDRDKILVEVGLFMPSKESEGFLEEKAQFVLQEEHFNSRTGFQDKDWLGCLQKGKLWGEDILFSESEDVFLKGEQIRLKIELPGAKETVFCFIGVGDFLAWQAGKWVPIQRAEESLGQPLAQVKAISNKELELEVWDEEGFYPQRIRLESQNTSRLSKIPSGQIPHSARMRTSTQVACSFGERRYLVKPGDWVLKTARGWKVLKRDVDIQAYLHHKIRGVLCIVDALERDHGKLIMKGSWYNEMRTQMHHFSIPVSGDHSTRKLKQKEKKDLFLRESANSITSYFPASAAMIKGGNNE